MRMAHIVRNYFGILGEKIGGNLFALLFVCTLAVLAFGTLAEASQPVPRTMIGCVKNGEFISERGYVIRFRRSGSGDEIDLRKYNGRKIVADGNLLPGDNFFITKAPRIIGRCK